MLGFIDTRYLQLARIGSGAAVRGFAVDLGVEGEVFVLPLFGGCLCVGCCEIESIVVEKLGILECGDEVFGVKARGGGSRRGSIF